MHRDFVIQTGEHEAFVWLYKKFPHENVWRNWIGFDTLNMRSSSKFLIIRLINLAERCSRMWRYSSGELTDENLKLLMM